MAYQTTLSFRKPAPVPPPAQPTVHAGRSKRERGDHGLVPTHRPKRERGMFHGMRKVNVVRHDTYKLVFWEDPETRRMGVTARPRWPHQVAGNRREAAVAQAALGAQAQAQAPTWPRDAMRLSSPTDYLHYGEGAGYDFSGLGVSDAEDMYRDYLDDMKRAERDQQAEAMASGEQDAPIYISDEEAPTATVPDAAPKPEFVDRGPPLIAEQQHVVDLIVNGRNVFYTGSAGCGKSTVLKAAVARLRAEGKTVQVVAPTGKAALLVGGMTTWSYMGWTPDIAMKERKEVLRKAREKKTRQRLEKTDVLIIDEISMVENHFLERMDAAMRYARQYHFMQDGRSQPFGGVQVVVSGDFCQLPPVKPFDYCPQCGKKTETDGYAYDCPQHHGPWQDEDKWAFRSDVWDACQFVHINLQKVHRQSDSVFVDMLQKMRVGKPLHPADVDLLMNHEYNVASATQLFPTRDEVRRVNDTKFNQMKTPIYSYDFLDDLGSENLEGMVPDGFRTRNPDGSLRKLDQHRFDRQVRLRGGMLVLLQTNLDIRGGLVNGSTGIITGFEKYDPAKLPKVPRGRDGVPDGVDPLYGDHGDLMEYSIQLFAKQNLQANPRRELLWPRVRFLDNGKERVIYPHCSISSEQWGEGLVLLHRTQLPLLPGWAVTIHKSQGITLSRAVVDLSRAFEYEQMYVALSRAKSLHGLRIIGGREKLEQGNGGSAAVRQFLLDKFGQDE